SHASIDARLRDWDVLPGLTSPTGNSRNSEAKSVFWDFTRESRRDKMRRTVLVLVVVYAFLFSLLTFAQKTKPAETIPLDQIHTGMKGVAYTVFQGTKPESMEVEVLGVLKNANGPKGDIILVRLGGPKAVYTGVVAGMSGSPVYLNGKL